MRTFIGIGKGTPKTAVDEAVRGLSEPTMLLFIAPYQDIAEIATLLRERFPEVPCIGTIGTNLANGTVSEKNLALLGLFSDAKVSCGIISDISSCPLAEIKSFEEKVSQINPGREDTVCIEYCTGAEEMLATTLYACLKHKGVSMAGGTAFGAPDGKVGVVAYNGKVYEDTCVYALIKNTTGKIKVFKENIYKRQSEQTHFATKVNIKNRSIIELDGKPVADVYSKEVGIPKNKIVDNVLKNPMGRVVGDQVFISAMKELRENGELLNYKRINQNDCIYFLELDDYRKQEDMTRSYIKSEMKHISLVISIDCAHRYLLYQSDNYLEEYAKNMAAMGAHIGVVGGGEQYNNQHVNQTMVCAVFE